MEFDFQRGSLKREWLFWNREDGGRGPVRADDAWRAGAESSQLGPGSAVSLQHLRMSVARGRVLSASHGGRAIAGRRWRGRANWRGTPDRLWANLFSPWLAGRPTHLCETPLCVDAPVDGSASAKWVESWSQMKTQKSMSLNRF